MDKYRIIVAHPGQQHSYRLPRHLIVMDASSLT